MGWLVGVKFRSSPVHGFGVFAGERIRKGARIWEFDDSMRISTALDLAALPPDWLAFALHGGYYHRPADRLIWYDDGMQFMNHASDGRANAGLDHWPSIEGDHTVALRDIAEGEEIFEDYGFWADGNFGFGGWLEPFYRDTCPQHLEFLQSLRLEKVAA
jgi:uncharacterized protein